jgi:hypothetical protein
LQSTYGSCDLGSTRHFPSQKAAALAHGGRKQATRSEDSSHHRACLPSTVCLIRIARRPTSSRMKAYIAVPAIGALVYRAYAHKSLTPTGIVAAILTAMVHAVHPWNMPFVLLVVFFLAGSRVTNVSRASPHTALQPRAGAQGGFASCKLMSHSFCSVSPIGQEGCQGSSDNCFGRYFRRRRSPDAHAR